MKHDIFDNLFVLEIANNHWGDVERGKEIIRQHSKVARENNIKFAIKLQIRDVDNFVHHKYKKDIKIGYSSNNLAQVPGKSSRYIEKTLATRLSDDGYRELVDEIKKQGGIPMASAFDEKSVDLCAEIGIGILKIASQDIKSWTLIEKKLNLHLPTIVSNGGADIEELDEVVNYFNNNNVPLAINHCVSLYPSEDNDLELNKIDFLYKRYPNNIIGLSTHEYHNWSHSIAIAYAKGARTFERHIDIDKDNIPVSKYCSLPENALVWYQSFNITKEMCGDDDSDNPRVVKQQEKSYVQSVCRGVYALRDIKSGEIINKDGLGIDYYLSIPLHDGQLSSRDIIKNIELKNDFLKDDPIMTNL